MARPAPVLVVEDDPQLAGRIVHLLHKADLDIDGPYASVSDGIAALADHFPNVAIVDLHREDAGLLIDDLESYDIPFLLCPHDASTTSAGRSLLVEEEELASAILPRLIDMLCRGNMGDRTRHH